MSYLQKLFAPVWSRPYVLAILTMIMWGGNLVTMRASAGHIPPFSLSFWRWLLSFFVMLSFAWPYLRRDWPVMRKHKGLLIALGLTGITMPNMLTIVALQSTIAINALLLQAISPIFVALWAAVLLRHWLTLPQAVGLTVSIAGVVTIVAQGDMEILRALAFQPADMLIVLGLLIFGLYSPLTARMPPVHPFSLLIVMHGVATLAISSAYGWELARGKFVPLDLKSFGVLFYLILFGSVISMFTFNRAVELIGPNRAAQFINLVPVFGSIMAIWFLGETLRPYHIAGYLLVMAGVFIGTRRQNPAAPALPD